MIIYLLVFIVYLLLMIGIGWWYSKGIKTKEDYFLSARKFGPWPIGFTLAISFIGGGMFMGIVGFLQKYGIVSFLLIITMALGFVMLGLLIGPKLRRMNLTTLPEFIGRRFDQKARNLITIAALIVLLGSLAIQFKASGAILHIVFNIPYFWAVLLSVFIVTLYTVLGGFRSVVATDIIQTIIVFVGVILAFPFVFKVTGGTKIIPQLAKLQDGQFFNLFSQGFFFVIGGIIIATIYAFIAPENHQRIYASKDANSTKKAGLYAGLIYFVILSFVFLIGLAGLILYPNLENPDNFFPKLAVEILPTWLGAVLLAAVSAAIMSSGDTDLVTASSIFITDVYKKKASEKKILKISKISIVVISLIAFVIALIFPTVADLLLYYNSLMASIALCPIIFGLFWKKATKEAAFWSGIAGGGLNLILMVNKTDPVIAMVYSIAVSAFILIFLSYKEKMLVHLKSK